MRVFSLSEILAFKRTGGVEPVRDTAKGPALRRVRGSAERPAMEPAPEPEQPDVASMGVKAIKAALAASGVDFSGCFEKSELVQLLVAASAPAAAGAGLGSGAAPPATGR